MQYLANRYFNRAIFLLTTSADHKEPKEAEALGFRDLQIVNDMDVEIVDQCTEMGFTINRSERFELMISRIRGLLGLAQKGFSSDELYIEDQMNDFYNELKTALKNPSHELFKDMSISGRLQKFDTELIKYYRDVKQDTLSAAKVAIRMLIEDEYLFHEAEIEATKVLYAFQTSDTSYELRPADPDGSIKEELAAELKKLNDDYDTKRSSQIRSSLYSSTGDGFSRRASDIYAKESDQEDEDISASRASSAYRESCFGDFTMEQF